MELKTFIEEGDSVDDVHELRRMLRFVGSSVSGGLAFVRLHLHGQMTR